MADSKSTADVLLELMYSWIEKRELCARQLRKLARELEELRGICNAGETVGSSVSVVGAAALFGAGLATLFTGGAAAPLLGVAGAVSTGAGVIVSVGAKITEHFLSSSDLKKAQKIQKESDRIADKIQQLFQQLRKETMKTTSLTDDDKVDRHVRNRILGAMARRSSHHKLNDSSKNYFLNFIIEGMPQFGFGAETSQLSNDSGEVVALYAAVFSISAFFTVVGQKTKHLAKKGTAQLITLGSTAGVKTALKGGAMVAGGAVGMAFALPEAIDSWKEMIENNHVTEASQSLRDAADAIMQTTQTLREQLDTIEKRIETLRKQLDTIVETTQTVREQLDTISSSHRQRLRVFAEMERCIEDSNRSSEEKRKMRAFVLKMLEHEDFVEWVTEHSDPESIKSRCQTSLKVKYMFDSLKQALDKEKDKKRNKDDIHITFVAHGAIEQKMIPANTLLPASTIKDVVVYSPWNCAINAVVAYGVAKGFIEPQHRVFRCSKKNNCQIPDEDHQPTNLPHRWNSMKRAADKEQMIPNIIVSPLKKIKDRAWERFMRLQKDYGQPGLNRIVIPFILPDEQKDAKDARVPFSVVIKILSQELESSTYKTTVHLTACLSKISDDTTLDECHLKQQYACTIDNTVMGMPDKMLKSIDRENDLYRALHDLFG